MQIILDQEQQNEIQNLIISAVNKAVKNATNQRPYLTRKGIAEYFGVSPDTITHWASLGMPVATLEDGRKLYSKRSITEWLESKEGDKSKQHQKSPQLLK
ncbi:MAG: terminase small subunit [Anaeroplasma bactoclasticum]|nr:terminase small subunit [Anaeroplasma bactoclasticum]